MSKTGSNIIYNNNCERSEPYLSPKKIFDFFNLDILIYFVVQNLREQTLDIACRGGGWVYLYMKGSQMKGYRAHQYKTKDEVSQSKVYKNNCERSEPYLTHKKIFDFFNIDILIYFVIKSQRVYALDIACRGGGWVYLYLNGSKNKGLRSPQYKTKDEV